MTEPAGESVTAEARAADIVTAPGCAQCAIKDLRIRQLDAEAEALTAVRKLYSDALKKDPPERRVWAYARTRTAMAWGPDKLPKLLPQELRNAIRGCLIAAADASNERDLWQSLDRAEELVTELARRIEPVAPQTTRQNLKARKPKRQPKGAKP